MNSKCSSFYRQFSQGLRQVKDQFSTCQGNRRKITQNDEKVLCLHKFKDKKGSTAITKRDGEIPRANDIIELPQGNSIKSSESIRHHAHINLDLTLNHIR
ncbi:hypothetical protein CDL12_06938 [Handroanthus impetiginosus]|uniref:Uncharacterized protein n=1 Tax=Handroanthus impetiginosus TaxID=429701 RepID=A0A2G9HS52_9LAMI|nr:hypothetical protein CDL12_06938 [Handroanthus impetiginosus]